VAASGAEAGRKLYEKLSTFSNTFLEIGDAIGKAHATFERAKGQLSTGRGNAIRLAQKMTELGVGPAPGKAIRSELLGNNGDDAAERAPALQAPADGEDGQVPDSSAGIARDSADP
jgi:DNA anti-recombination protein RmuC